VKHARACAAALAVGAGVLVALPWTADAQYFGRNVVRYETFDFRVLSTEHFDIYYYEDNAEHIDLVARMAERWQARLADVLDHELTLRQPIILYASHPHFRQTTTSPADIGEGTGGFTEIFRNRVVLPFGGTLDETDHVLGHELVHAFQFDMTGRAADPERFGNIPGAIRLPLWLVEGMAEYLSVGPYHSLTAMWLRDLVARDQTIDRRRLQHPLFQPYRHGHGFMAYIGGRFGDPAVGRLLVEAAATRQQEITQAFPRALNVELDDLLADWNRDLRDHFGPMVEDAQAADEIGRVLLPGVVRDLPSINLGPSLSPDGRRLIYLAQPQRLTLDLHLLDVETGEIIRRITRTALDPHLEALQFVRSAGDWHPDGTRFVFAGIRQGRPVLEIVDGERGASLATHALPGLDEAFNAVWSPDGRRIALTGMRQGFTDLYVYDLERRELTRLTEDIYSALQPAWSPDGSRIAFATDRMRMERDALASGRHGLALVDVDSGAIEDLPTIPGAQLVNPNWSFDGTSLYFLADARGTSNIYRMTLADRAIHELTNVKTGVSGLTALSPALSVAGPRDTMAFTLFDGGGFAVVLIDDGAAMTGTALADIEHGEHLALLPPVQRQEQLIARYLDRPAPELPADPVLDVRDYRARIRPEFISQATIGAGTGAFGTFVGGGISLHWSDMLGRHNVVTQIQSEFTDGDFLDTVAARVAYENRVGRYDWGGVVAQVPSLSAGFGQAITTVDGQQALVQQAVRFWEINRVAAGRIAYPFSRAMRAEVEGGIRHISYEAEQFTRAFSLATGERLFDERQDLPTPSSLNLWTANTALVYDTSIFGGTSAALGQRWRLEAGAVGGDLTFFTPLVDYRRYWMPFEERSLTIAARAMHFGRYGSDAEDPRLRPIFLGSPALVRGYETGFGLFEDPVFDRLQGSRIAVANVELRLPLTGVRGFIGGALFLPIEAAAFYDAGVAWSRGERPNLIGGDQSGVTSYGVALRTNLGGLVLALNYVNPPQFTGRDWHWQFTIAPGF
jgi:Tol biopolymer transport system component